jgi:TolA-binding protein
MFGRKRIRELEREVSSLEAEVSLQRHLAENGDLHEKQMAVRIHALEAEIIGLRHDRDAAAKVAEERADRIRELRGDLERERQRNDEIERDTGGMRRFAAQLQASAEAETDDAAPAAATAAGVLQRLEQFFGATPAAEEVTWLSRRPEPVEVGVTYDPDIDHTED